MNRVRARWLRAFGVLILSTGAAFAVDLEVVPESREIGEGESVTVDVRISNRVLLQPALGTFDITLNFDPTILDPDPENNGLEDNIVFGTALDVEDLRMNLRSSTLSDGSLGVFEVSLSDPRQLDSMQKSSFSLFTVSFSAIGSGIAKLTLGSVILGDSLGDPLLADLKDQQIVRIFSFPRPIHETQPHVAQFGDDGVKSTVPLVRASIDFTTSIDCNNDSEIIAVTILTTEDFDAVSVDHSTVNLEGASVTHLNEKGGNTRHEEDADGDGDTDLVLHFRLGDTTLNCSSTEGTVEGKTFDGTIVEGTDSVHMVPTGPKVTTVP